MNLIFNHTILGQLALKNHLIRSATWENKTTEDGHMTPELYDIYAVGVSRPLLAEPDLFLRWKNGDSHPAKCVSCSKCRTPDGNYCTVFKNNN